MDHGCTNDTEPRNGEQTAMKFAACLVCLSLSMGCATMQKPSELAARPGDVDTIEHVIRTDYECVSGPAGLRDQVRQKQRDDTLYMPNVVFVSCREENGQPKSEILTEETYWAGFGAESPDK